MDKTSKIKNRVKNVKLIILSCILIMLIMLISTINRSGLEAIHVGGSMMPVSPLSGVITVFMLLVSLQMLNIDNKKGFAAAVILNAVQLISVSRAFFSRGICSPLRALRPCAAVWVCCICSIVISIKWRRTRSGCADCPLPTR